METFAPKGKVHGFIMPDFIFNDSRLSLAAKTLYALLCNYAGERDHCWPSHKTLAAKLGCSVSSVKTYLKQLSSYKLIQASDGAGQTVRSCLYYLLRPAALSSSVCSQNLPTPQSNSGYKYNLKEIKKNIPLPPQTASSTMPQKKHERGGYSLEVKKAFEECFMLYPKKESKELALFAWLSLSRKGSLPSVEILKQAIAEASHSEQWQKDGGRYIPHFSNYLRGHKWEEFLGSIQEKKTIAEEHAHPRKAFEQQEEEAKNSAAHLRSIFNDVSKKFTQGVHGAAFGLWALLYQKGQAPALEDLPTEPDTNFFAWLTEYKNKQQFLTQ